MAKTGKKKTLKTAAKKSEKIAAKANKKSARMTTKRKAKTVRNVQKAASKKVDPLNRKQVGAMTPMLAVRNVRRAVEFCTQGLGFKLRGMMEGPGGIVTHAELKLRDAVLMLSPEEPGHNSLSAQTIGNTPATLYIMVENVDDVYKQAVAAGGKTLMPVTEMFWGDRCCMIADAEGNKWMVATHRREVTEAEMRAQMERQMQSQQAAPGQQAAAAAAADAESEY